MNRAPAVQFMRPQMKAPRKMRKVKKMAPLRALMVGLGVPVITFRHVAPLFSMHPSSVEATNPSAKSVSGHRAANTSQMRLPM